MDGCGFGGSDMKIIIDHTPEPTENAVLSDGVFAAYADLVGERDRSFSVFLKNNSGKILGGLQAFFDTESIYIKSLWVDDAYRHQGHGKQLLRVAEQEGIQQGCRLSTVDTWDFQAEGFYVKNGYVRMGEIKNYWKGYSMIFLRKVLKG